MNSDLPKEMDSDPVETSIDLFSNQRNPLGADLSVGPGVVQAPQLLFRCARGGGKPLIWSQQRSLRVFSRKEKHLGFSLLGRPDLKLLQSGMMS